MNRLFLFFGLTALTPTLLSAQSALTRDGAIATALRQNRELKVAAIEIDRAKSRLHWSGRLPNPELELSTRGDGIGLDEGEDAFEIAFTQRFPVTSRLKKEKSLRKKDVELAEIEFTVRERQLAYEVDKAWLGLNAAKSAERLQGKLRDLNKNVVTFLSDGAKVGEASPLDVAQATLNGKLIEQQLAVSGSLVAAAEAKLKQLAGIDPKKPIAIAAGTSLPEKAPAKAVSFSTVLKNRPDFSALLMQSNVNEAQLALAVAQRWDDIAVKIFIESDESVDEPSGLDRNTFGGIGISIPLPLRDRNEVAIEDAKLDIEQAKRAREAKTFAVHSELEAALAARTAAYKLAAESGGDVLQLAQKNFEDFQEAQRNGQASLLQVQQAQQQLLQFETAAVELLATYFQTDAEVRFIAGTYPRP